MGVPPHQETKQQSEHLLRDGQYASCVPHEDFLVFKYVDQKKECRGFWDHDNRWLLTFSFLTVLVPVSLVDNDLCDR